MILTVASEDLQVVVPTSAYSLDGFREWVASDSFPERGGVTYYRQEVLLDMSPERFESHSKVKSEISRVLGNLVKECDLGTLCDDGLWITNDGADLSNEADSTFLSWDSLKSGKILLVQSTLDSDGIEMRGSPDWVLEVISKSSKRKDTVLLPKAYHAADVREYWLVDARGDEIEFTIFVWRVDKFETVEPDGDGWRKSEVFPRSFRLDRNRDPVGGWAYTLGVR